MANPPTYLMETYSGKFVSVQNIRAEDVDWRDVAHSLSLLCRFTGHCRRFYSVAAHSIHCYYAAKLWQLSDPLCICMLIHDAAEAYWHDLGSPHKAVPSMSSYKQYLDIAQQSIYKAAKVHNVAANAHNIMRRIDLGILKEEARRLLKSCGNWDFAPYNTATPIYIPTFRWLWYLWPRNAERKFLKVITRWVHEHAAV